MPTRAPRSIRADTLVTPINDSFIDLDLIGQVDAETYKVRRPSFYAELVWEARKQRGKRDGGDGGLGGAAQPPPAYRGAQHEARGGRRWASLSKRVGFRVIPGLSERVIFRELFPKGLTLLDLAAIGGAGHRPYRRAAGTARDGVGAGAARLAGRADRRGR